MGLTPSITGIGVIPREEAKENVHTVHSSGFVQFVYYHFFWTDIIV